MIYPKRLKSWLAVATILCTSVIGARADDIIDKGRPTGGSRAPLPRPAIERSTDTQPKQHGAAAAPKVAQRWGLLIGIDDYANARDLDYCGADQRALYKSLLAAGFSADQLFLLDDDAKENRYRPSQRNIQKQLDVVLSLAAEGDLIVLSFSGHGVSFDGKSYLCPNDMTIDDPSTLISLDAIYERLRDCKATFKLLIIDACRNDPRPGGTRSAAPTEDAKRLAKEIQETKIPEGVVLLNSCAPGEVSREDPELGHGVFMNYILEGLKGPADKDGDGAISLYELQSYAVVKTKTHVARRFNDAQRPFYKIEGDATAMEYALLSLPGGGAAATARDKITSITEKSAGSSAERATRPETNRPTPDLPDDAADEHGWIGLLYSRFDYNLRPVLHAVTPGGPADAAGMRAGDLITKVGGVRLTRPDQIHEAMQALKPGDTITFEAEREGTTKEFTLQLRAPPADRGLSLFRPAAESGSASAMHGLSRLYSSQKKTAESFFWLRNAVDAGDLLATFELANCYQNGRLVPRDEARAKELLQKIIDAPDSKRSPVLRASCLDLTAYYDLRGTTAGKNDQQAVQLLREAIDLGSITAMWRLSLCLRDGKGVEKNLLEAVTLCRRAAEAGYPPAQNTLGLMYHSGSGVEKDSKLAAEWLKKAVAGHSTAAMHNLARMYKTGDGVPQDLAKAEELSRRAGLSSNPTK